MAPIATAASTVIGSSVKLRVEMKDGRPVLMKTAELGSFDDREVTVQNLGLHIGLHHDDAEREAAYDREFILSPLDKANEHGITVVSVKRDWKVVFG